LFQAGSHQYLLPSLRGVSEDMENVNKFQNPFRRPVATTIFFISTVVALWLGIGATLPIEKYLTLGLF